MLIVTKKCARRYFQEFKVVIPFLLFRAHLNLAALRHPLIFYSDILGRCFGKWESREKGFFVHAKLPDSHDCIGEHLRN